MKLAAIAPPAWPPLWQSNTYSQQRRQRLLLRCAIAASLLVHGGLLLNLPGLHRNDPQPIPLQASFHYQPPAQQPAMPRTDQALAPSQPTEARRLPPQHVKAVAPATLRAKEGAAGPTMTASKAPDADLPTDSAATATKTVAASSSAPTASRDARLTPSANDSAALERYGRSLAELLARQQQYPRLAAMRGWEGEVRLQVRVARKGNIVDVQLSHSSGFAVLDQQALQLMAAAALPPLPDSVQEAEVQLIVPIHFKLNKAT